jgi:hypothetical protein
LVRAGLPGAEAVNKKIGIAIVLVDLKGGVGNTSISGHEFTLSLDHFILRRISIAVNIIQIIRIA